MTGLDARRDGLPATFVAVVLIVCWAYAGPVLALGLVLGGFGLGCVVGWLARDYLSREHKETR
jgi:hypothetical protein